MAYYRTCPDCGAALDPGEKCDCQEKSEQLEKRYEELITIAEGGQITISGGLYAYNQG